MLTREGGEEKSEADTRTEFERTVWCRRCVQRLAANRAHRCVATTASTRQIKCKYCSDSKHRCDADPAPALARCFAELALWIILALQRLSVRLALFSSVPRWCVALLSNGQFLSTVIGFSTLSKSFVDKILSNSDDAEEQDINSMMRLESKINSFKEKEMVYVWKVLAFDEDNSQNANIDRFILIILETGMQI